MADRRRGDHVDRGDPSTGDREGHDRDRRLERSDEHARRAVDECRPAEPRKRCAAGEDRAGDRLRTPCRGGMRAAAAYAEDDVRIEQRDERVEVALAGRGEARRSRRRSARRCGRAGGRGSRAGARRRGCARGSRRSPRTAPRTCRAARRRAAPPVSASPARRGARRRPSRRAAPAPPGLHRRSPRVPAARRRPPARDERGAHAAGRGTRAPRPSSASRPGSRPRPRRCGSAVTRPPAPRPRLRPSSRACGRRRGSGARGGSRIARPARPCHIPSSRSVTALTFRTRPM